MLSCINLLETFGDRYHITFDESYDPRGKPRDRLDPWYMQIAGKFGVIYPEGGQYLRVDIDYHNQIAARVAALPGCTLVQDGDHEKTIRFHIDQFLAVAAIVQPRRKRIIPPQLAEARMKTLFKTRLPEQKIDPETASEATT